MGRATRVPGTLVRPGRPAGLEAQPYRHREGSAARSRVESRSSAGGDCMVVRTLRAPVHADRPVVPDGPSRPRSGANRGTAHRQPPRLAPVGAGRPPSGTSRRGSTPVWHHRVRPHMLTARWFQMGRLARRVVPKGASRPPSGARRGTAHGQPPRLAPVDASRPPSGTSRCRSTPVWHQSTRAVGPGGPRGARRSPRWTAPCSGGENGVPAELALEANVAARSSDP